ncbi:hypothetical protein ACWGIB_23995 [Streptomyces xiamenensis]
MDVPAVVSAAGDARKGALSARAGEPPRGAADGAVPVPVARWTAAAGPGPGRCAPVAGLDGGAALPVAAVSGPAAGVPLPPAERVGGTTGEGEALADRWTTGVPGRPSLAAGETGRTGAASVVRRGTAGGGGLSPCAPAGEVLGDVPAARGPWDAVAGEGPGTVGVPGRLSPVAGVVGRWAGDE